VNWLAPGIILSWSSFEAEFGQFKYNGGQKSMSITREEKPRTFGPAIREKIDVGSNPDIIGEVKNESIWL
jgi:hypothetical protein